jgi:hypothetical protein
MPEKATGNWPANVSAVIITQEEKAAQLAQAPPGGIQTVQTHPQGAPYADVTVRQVVPNVLTTPKPAGANMTNNIPTQPPAAPQPAESQPVEEESEVFYGKQALTLAKQMGTDFVWKSDDMSPIDLATAAQMIGTQGSRSVCFDFEALAALPDPDDETDEPENPDPYMAVPVPPAEVVPGAQVPPGMPVPTQSGKMVVQQNVVQGRQHVDPVSEREKMAFGNVLTTPGQTVYMRPNVIRVEVEGNVRVQKGIKGNVRMMRITRLDPVSGNVQLANAIRTNVQPPNVPSPNPQATYRTAQPEPDKVTVPRPQVPVPEVNTATNETADNLEEFEF